MTATVEPIELPGPARRTGLLRTMIGNPVTVIAGAVLILVVLAAVFAPVIAPQGPNAASLSDVFAPISADHLLGGDSAGRDLLARLVFGARNSLLGALIATLIAATLGIPAGLIGGYYGGWFDAAASWAASLLMALPGIVVLLAFRAAVSPSVWAGMAVFGVLLSPAFYRLVRSGVVSVRNELYVDAARVSGVGDARIIGRHVLGVVRAPIIIQAGMILAIGLVIQAGLEFLGLGDLTAPSWGSMLNEGFQNIYRAPQLLFWPGMILTITIAGLALLSNGVRDALGSAGMRSAIGVAPAEDPPPVVIESAVDHGVAGDLLRIDGLRISYGDRLVVHDATLRVDQGEVVGLVGESGSGKTQTVLAVLGLLSEGGRVAGGKIEIDGKITDERDRVGLLGHGTGYVPQEPMSNLDPAFTIGSQLIEPIRRQLRLSRAEARRRSVDLLARVGIAEPERTMRSYPHQISGGMAQRVLIAGAISCGPRLLIADEPTTALDVTVQAEILDLLRDLQAETGMGVVIVTHNFGVVADLCDRVYVMRDGRIVEGNRVGALFTKPCHPYTRSLLAATLDGGPSRVDLDRIGQP